jgi:hypothetical protein
MMIKTVLLLFVQVEACLNSRPTPFWGKGEWRLVRLRCHRWVSVGARSHSARNWAKVIRAATTATTTTAWSTLPLLPKQLPREPDRL